MVIKHVISPAENHSEVEGFSVVEIAKWAGISRSQIYKEMKAGRLVPDKVGRRTVIWKSEAERWRANLPKYVVQ